MGKALILIAVLALTACTMTRGGNFCDLSKPIRPSQAVFEAMSEREIDAMLVHNRTGEKLCGWQP